MYTAIIILGGVALILHGVRTLRKGLDRLFGSRLGSFLQKASGSRGGAVLTGVGMSLLAPSSTSVSVLAVQAVRLGHVTAARMLLVLLGADIGLTFTIQLLSLHVEHSAPVFLALGVGLYQYARSGRAQGLGQVLLSFGFLFLGLTMIGTAAAGIAPDGDMAALLRIAGHYPVWLAIASALLTVLLQSSTATVGLVLGLGSGGGLVLSTELAVAAVVGANVGVAVTMILVGWDHAEARRLGVSNLIAKLGTGLLVLGLIGPVVALLSRASTSLPRQVADAHTGFNLLKAILVLPTAALIARLAERVVPANARVSLEAGAPLYLAAGPLDGSNVALSQSMREILRVADIVRSMADDAWRALRDNDEGLARNVGKRDNQVDLLEAEIKRFLAKLASHSLGPDQAAERLRQLQYLSELEAIGDLIDKNLCSLIVKKIRRRLSFPADAWAALDDLDRRVAENMQLADAAFHTRDRALAAKLLRHKAYVDRRVVELRDEHLSGLNGEHSIWHDAVAVHLDLLTNLRRINSHVSRVAYVLLQAPASSGAASAGEDFAPPLAL